MKLTLDDFKIITRYDVHWGDMDAARHVNNLVYMRWTESARIHYFQMMEMDTSFLGGGVGPILGWQDCKYIFPMTYPDTAIVGLRTVEILEDRFIMQCAVFSEQHQRLASLGKQSIIPYNYKELRKVPLPGEWVEGINKLEGK